MKIHSAIKKCIFLPYYCFPLEAHFLFLANSAEFIGRGSGSRVNLLHNSDKMDVTDRREDVCPSDLPLGGQVRSIFYGAISFSWFIQESVLA